MCDRDSKDDLVAVILRHRRNTEVVDFRSAVCGPDKIIPEINCIIADTCPVESYGIGKACSIVAAGNGFTIERKFFREVTVEEKYNDKTEDKNRNVTELQEIKPGEQLHVGDKILMKYCIWNQENRSFVRLTAPREASLRPVDQLSGHYGWRFNPLRISRFYTLSPQGYRNVKAEKTEYYFDTYPEEKTEISEEFFVTEAGTFKAPVVSIESLYAPHYRANDGFKAVLDVAP